MNKKERLITLFTSILCLMPLIWGIALYQSLPEQIAVHWSNGQADRFFSKEIVCFGLPFVFLLINLFSKFRLFTDPKSNNHPKVLRFLSIWAVPVLAVVILPVTLYISLGFDIYIDTISNVVIGLLIIIMGNYLPKTKQNYTIGKILPWTLDNDENWKKTNRFTGFLWVICGTILLIYPFVFNKVSLPLGIPISVVIGVVLLLVPVAYSYMLYKRKP